MGGGGGGVVPASVTVARGRVIDRGDGLEAG